jgi:hypothetical protein
MPCKIVKSIYVDPEFKTNGWECSEPIFLFSIISEETRGLAVWTMSRTVPGCRGSTPTAETGTPFVQTFELICWTMLSRTSLMFHWFNDTSLNSFAQFIRHFIPWPEGVVKSEVQVLVDKLSVDTSYSVNIPRRTHSRICSRRDIWCGFWKWGVV